MRDLRPFDTEESIGEFPVYEQGRDRGRVRVREGCVSLENRGFGKETKGETYMGVSAEHSVKNRWCK